MKIGDRVYVHGYVDEIRKDTMIIRNEGGYFGTVKSEIVEAQKAEDIVSVIRCKDCIHWHDGYCMSPDVYVADQEYMTGDLRTEATHYCGYAERKEE